MSLLEWQNQLSQYLLLPESSHTPLLSRLPKLSLYEELLLNTTTEALEGIYPYTVQCLQVLTDWQDLAETYRRAYPTPSYKLMETAAAFPDFLSQQQDLLKECPYLVDLACYEWLDMVVANLPDIPLQSPTTISILHEIPSIEDWANWQPVWNPIRRLVQFEYNIPEILTQLDMNTIQDEDGENETHPLSHSIQALPWVHPEPVDILFYRDPETLHSRFFALNPLTAAWASLYEDDQTHLEKQTEDFSLDNLRHLTYEASLYKLCQQIPALEHLPMEVIQQQAIGLFQNCLNAKILLGSSGSS